MSILKVLTNVILYSTQQSERVDNLKLTNVLPITCRQLHGFVSNKLEAYHLICVYT